MRISLIVAMGRNLVIGTGTGMPWHLPNDLKRFRRLTLGKPIVMGRKTYETIGRPLDGRDNIILTHNPTFTAPSCYVVRNVEEALVVARERASERGADEVMVIGGAEVYRQFLPHAERIYLTVVEGEFAGTAYFPAELPAGTDWTEGVVERLDADARNLIAHRFVILDRCAAVSNTTRRLTSLVAG